MIGISLEEKEMLRKKRKRSLKSRWQEIRAWELASLLS